VSMEQWHHVLVLVIRLGVVTEELKIYEIEIMKLLITEGQYKRIFLLGEQLLNPVGDYQSGTPFKLDNAPEWFDKNTAQWLNGPTGGGLYVDKYGSTYGEYGSERKKPLSDAEKKKVKDAEVKLKQYKYDEMMKGFEGSDALKPFQPDFKEYDGDPDRTANAQYGNFTNAGLGADGKPIPHIPLSQEQIALNKELKNAGIGCKARQIQKCKNKGMVATTVYISGKEMNRIHRTGGGGSAAMYWEWKEYAQCRCVDPKGDSMRQGKDYSYETKYQYDQRMEKGRQAYDTEIRRMERLGGKSLSSETIHIVLDVLSIIAYASGVGLPIALGLESLNAALYFAEGDNISGGIAAAFAFIPGGTIARRAFGNKIVLKQVDHVIDKAIKAQKGGQTITREVMEKELKESLGEKTFNKNAGKINAYFKIAEESGVNATKKSITRYKKWITNTQDQYKAFIKDEKLVQGFMNLNGDNLERAYAAYLKSLPLPIKKSIKGVAAYFAILEGINELVTVPAVQENMAKAIEYLNSIETTYIPGDWTLADDAKKGNIASIVRLAGYEWESVKFFFGVDPNSSYNDNVLLKKAWKSGWRPFKDKNKEPEAEDIIPVPEQYQTTTYKKEFGVEDLDFIKHGDEPINIDDMGDDTQDLIFAEYLKQQRELEAKEDKSYQKK